MSGASSSRASEVAMPGDSSDNPEGQVQDNMVDPFERLTDDVVVLIFDRVCEAKWLCMSYLVSKRFASLVLNTRTVSFTIPYLVKHPSLPQKVKKFFSKTLRLFSPQKKMPLLAIVQQSTAATQMVRHFLAKFSNIESLRVEEIFVGENPLGDYLVRWSTKVNLGSPSDYVFIIAQNLTAAPGNHDDDMILADDNASHLQGDELKALKKKFSHHLRDANFRCRILKSMLSSFPKLKDAVLIDSQGQGSVIAEEAKIVELRKGKKAKKTIDAVLKAWYVPVLRLPASGFVMHGATLVILKTNIIDDDFSIVENVFKEAEYSEAAMLMAKKQAFYDHPFSYEDYHPLL